METPKAIETNVINIGGIDLEVVVLDNGRRVIEQNSFIKLMEAMYADDQSFNPTEEEVRNLARFIR